MGSVPQDGPHHHPLQRPVPSPGYLSPVLLTNWQVRGSGDTLLEFNSFAREAHRTQRNTFASLLKDFNEEPDKDIHRTRSGRIRRADYFLLPHGCPL